MLFADWPGGAISESDIRGLVAPDADLCTSFVQASERVCPVLKMAGDPKTERLLGGGSAPKGSATHRNPWKIKKLLLSSGALELLLMVVTVLWAYDGKVATFWDEHAAG